MSSFLETFLPLISHYKSSGLIYFPIMTLTWKNRSTCFDRGGAVWDAALLFPVSPLLVDLFRQFAMSKASLFSICIITFYYVVFLYFSDSLPEQYISGFAED